MEKKNLFGGQLPNLAGFDYYVSGIYVMQGYKSNENILSSRDTMSPFVSEFDWRNRHGKNWITPVKNQGGCGSCWAFSSVGTVEAYINLYYNQLLNLDLSEQELVSCTAALCTAGGTNGGAFIYLENTGVVDESCFSYVASKVPCDNKCLNPDEKIKIEGHTQVYPFSITSDDLKKLVIQVPVSIAIHHWGHALGLIGFKTIQEGDSIFINTSTGRYWVTITSEHPLIGSTAWILKNSWGDWWGDHGFGYVVTNWGTIWDIFYPSDGISSLNYTDTDIVCTDRDGDGYCYWGVGPKPATCPCLAPDEPDGDDSNPGLGSMDEYGNCISITSLTDSITISQTWNATDTIYKTITIQPNVTLTITGNIYCTNNAQIIVQPGGKLMLNGGTLTAACSDNMWQGIVILGNPNQPQLPLYQGTVELKNGARIEHALCAISAAPDGYDNFTGGIISASDAVFCNNLQAIEYRPYENMNSNGTVIDNTGKFTNCIFTVNTNNHFSGMGRFKQHVSLWEVRGVAFEGCIFENKGPYYLAKGIVPTPPENYGIYTMDAGFRVKNYCKPRGSTGIDCPCLSSHTMPSTFKSHTTGIRSENTGNSRYIHIDQSDFQYLGTGVRMNTQSNYRLTRCDFSNIKTGLYSSNSSGYKIEANNFSAHTASATGISMNNSGGAENKIYKNNFNNFDKGISVSGINGTTPRLTGLQFLRNTFTDNKYDIYISQQATVRPNQGNSSSGADNKFTGTDISSIYSLSTQTINYYRYPGNIYTPYNPTGNIVIYNAAYGSDASTLCDVTRTEIFTDSLEQYKMMQAQYDKLVAELEGNPEVLQDILMLSDAMRELSDHAISRILQDSILYLESLKPWYEAVRTPVAKYSLAEVYFYERKYEQAEAVLKEIPALFSFDEPEQEEHDNYMQFYNFKKQLQLAERNWTELKEDEIVQLQAIAEATQGRSSSMAQGVLCFFFDICYEDKIEGEGDIPQKNAPVETQTTDIQNHDLNYELSLYPNPAQSEMTVSSNNPAVKIVQMEIYDVTGRKVYQQAASQSYGTLKLNGLAQGIYILKVRMDNEDMVVKKIVKQ